MKLGHSPNHSGQAGVHVDVVMGVTQGCREGYHLNMVASVSSPLSLECDVVQLGACNKNFSIMVR